MNQAAQAALDAIEQMQLSEGYTLAWSRLSDELERRRLELEKPADQPKTDRLRGMIEGLRIALAIPGVMISELKQEVLGTKE